MGQQRLTREALEDILGHINVDRVYETGYYFSTQPKGDGFLLQLIYHEKCVDTEEPATQFARKWYISSFSTKSEVVQTAFKAVLTSAEHRTREHFLYKGERVMSPHFDIDERVEFCKEQKNYEKRK